MKGPAYNRGFSLLEMTVVIGIAAIMTAIVLWNLPSIKGGISIDLVAQEFAIYLRGAQVYSRATKVGIGGATADYSSYGLHVSKTDTVSAGVPSAPGKFFLWADADNSIKFGTDFDWSQLNFDPARDSVQESYDLPAGFRVTGIKICQHGGWIEPADVDVVFIKPDPEAFITCSESACRSAGGVLFAQVFLTSPNKVQTRAVEIYNNGQIAVWNPANAAGHDLCQ
jgi:prepilin-type N-terminal cleavage/methylation domain-containing protein